MCVYGVNLHFPGQTEILQSLWAFENCEDILNSLSCSATLLRISTHQSTAVECTEYSLFFFFITSPPKNGIHFYLIGSLMPNKLFKKLNNVWLWSDKLTPVLLFKNCSANISWMFPVFETLLDCLVKSNSTRRKVWVSLHRKRYLFVCTGGANPLVEKEFFQVLAPHYLLY